MRNTLVACANYEYICIHNEISPQISKISWDLREISRFHEDFGIHVRFQDFTKDFTKISRFHERFQDFKKDFTRSVRDFSEWLTPRVGAIVICISPLTALMMEQRTSNWQFSVRGITTEYISLQQDIEAMDRVRKGMVQLLY